MNESLNESMYLEIVELEKMLCWASGKDLDRIKEEYRKHKEEYPEMHQ